MLRTYENETILDTGNIWNLVYPVGCLYWSTINRSPTDYFASALPENFTWSWEPVYGLVYAIDANDEYDLDLLKDQQIGDVSGSNTVTLSIDNLPEHKHSITTHSDIELKLRKDNKIALAIAEGSGENLASFFSQESGKTGGNKPIDILPKRTLAYCWRRIK